MSNERHNLSLSVYKSGGGRWEHTAAHSKHQRPPPPRQTHPHQQHHGSSRRNRGLGTLGACTISPSSAYGLLRAEWRVRRARGWRMTPRRISGVPCRSILLQAVTDCYGLLKQLGGQPGCAPRVAANRVLGTLGACMISPSSAYVLLWACVARNRAAWHTRPRRRTAQRGTRRRHTAPHTITHSTQHARHTEYTRRFPPHTTQRLTESHTARHTCVWRDAHMVKVSISVFVFV